jgi:hypothetical protein
MHISLADEILIYEYVDIGVKLCYIYNVKLKCPYRFRKCFISCNCFSICLGCEGEGWHVEMIYICRLYAHVLSMGFLIL